MTAKHTPGPIRIRKCPCGDPICDQHTLSTQGSAGFSRADATLYSEAPAMAKTLRLMLDLFDHPGLIGLILRAKRHGWTQEHVNERWAACRKAEAIVHRLDDPRP